MKVHVQLHYLQLSTIALSSLVITACGSTQNSRVKVFGGRPASAIEAPGTLKITAPSSAGTITGSGAFYRHNVFITCRHVIGDAKKVSVYLPDGAVVSSERIHMPALAQNQLKYMSGIYQMDIAAVEFPDHTAGDDLIVSIAKVPPKVGDVVHLAGFGRINADASGPRGTKNIGDARIDFIYDEMRSPIDQSYYELANFSMQTKFASLTKPVDLENGSGGMPGDSGSPIYNEQWEVIGIAAANDARGHVPPMTITERVFGRPDDVYRGALTTKALTLFSSPIADFMAINAGVSAIPSSEKLLSHAEDVSAESTVGASGSAPEDVPGDRFAAATEAEKGR